MTTKTIKGIASFECGSGNTLEIDFPDFSFSGIIIIIKNEQIEYKIDMKYKGKNTFIKQSVDVLNSLSKIENGKKILKILINSNRKFFIRNKSLRKGTAQFVANMNEKKYSGGGDINVGEGIELGVIAHELFHAYQYEKIGTGFSINSEIEAYLFQDHIMFEKAMNSGGGISSTSVSNGLKNKEGEIFKNAYKNLWSFEFNLKSFKEATLNFKKGCTKNINGDYNNFPLLTFDSKNILIKDFYPLYPF